MTEFGIEIDVKDEQFKNARSLIAVTEFGMEIASDMYFSNDVTTTVLSLSYIIPFSIMKF